MQNRNRKIKTEFRKRILARNVILTEELLQHKSEFVEAVQDAYSIIKQVHDHLCVELLDLERQSEPFSDQVNTIDYVLNLRAQFFKPTLRNVIDASIAPLLASAPGPSITEYEPIMRDVANEVSTYQLFGRDSADLSNKTLMRFCILWNIGLVDVDKNPNTRSTSDATFRALINRT